MIEHTPGPWTTMYLGYRGGPDDKPFGLTIDDARVADAAPKMLEALEAITDCWGLGSSPDQFCEQVADFMDEAREAIAKSASRWTRTATSCRPCSRRRRTSWIACSGEISEIRSGWTLIKTPSCSMASSADRSGCSTCGILFGRSLMKKLLVVIFDHTVWYDSKGANHVAHAFIHLMPWSPATVRDVR